MNAIQFENVAIKDGNVPMVVRSDNDDLHIAKHRAATQDIDARTNPRILWAYDQHIKMHEDNKVTKAQHQATIQNILQTVMAPPLPQQAGQECFRQQVSSHCLKIKVLGLNNNQCSKRNNNMEQSTATPSGMISTPAGGFISDSDETDDVGLIGDDEQYDFNSNDSEKETYQNLSNETKEEKEEKVKEQKRAYKSNKFGEVPEDVVERLLAYKDRVQDLDKLDEVDKFRAEIQTAANKKFLAAKKEREEVAQERQAAQSVLEYAKANPLEFLKATGVDINQHIRTRLEEDMKLAQMTPEQRQEYYKSKRI